MQHCHVVTQQGNARALGFDARFLQPSSKGQRFAGLHHLTASHSQPPEVFKVKQLCVKPEQAEHPAFTSHSREQSCEFHLRNKSNFSWRHCQSSTLWFQLLNARCSWNVQKDNTVKSESAKPCQLLEVLRLKDFAETKNVSKHPLITSYSSLIWSFKEHSHLTWHLLLTHAPQMEDCQNVLINPIINKWFCLRNNRSDKGKPHVPPGMQATLRALHRVIFLCFPYQQQENLKPTVAHPLLRKAASLQGVTQWQ